MHVHSTEHDSYLSFSQKFLSWPFLALAQLRGTAQVWNPLGISNSWKKVNCCLSYDSFLAHASLQGNSAAFLATNTSQRDLQPAYSSPIKVLLSLRKVVRFRNFLRTWLPRRLSLVGADIQTRRVSQNPNTREPKKEILGVGHTEPCLHGSHLLTFLGGLNGFHVRTLVCSSSEQKNPSLSCISRLVGKKFFDGESRSTCTTNTSIEETRILELWSRRDGQPQDS